MFFVVSHCGADSKKSKTKARKRGSAKVQTLQICGIVNSGTKKHEFVISEVRVRWGSQRHTT